MMFYAGEGCKVDKRVRNVFKVTEERHKSNSIKPFVTPEGAV